MNRMKKLLSLLLVLTMVFSLAAMTTGCKDSDEPGSSEASTEATQNSTAPAPSTPSEPTTPSEPGSNKDYQVTVSTVGGMKLDGISVYVYTDSTLTELEAAGETDDEGTVTLSMPEKDGYAVEIQGVPEGYLVEDYYLFLNETANIQLTSALITDKTLSDVSGTLGLGDVMYDFTVMAAGYTDADGNIVADYEVKLSDVLAEKDMVLLNFWYSSCGPCANEFPYMDQAFQSYTEDAAVIAVDPLEDLNTVKTFKSSMGLSITMAACPYNWASIFNVTGYPTSVVIDRYGVICLIEVGGITSLTPFTSIFEHFTGEDYEQKLCPNGVNDIIVKVKPQEQMPESDEISGVLTQGDMTVTFRPEADDEYSWPFLITEKNGESCIMSSNKAVDDSYAIIYADVTLQAGQAVGFDYLASSELGADYMHVIVNDEAIFSISGADEVEQWKSCYPCVAAEDGVYEIALCYIKDSSDHAGDDAVYVKNLRVIDASEIDTATYLPREAAVETENGFEYVEVFYNANDGYYHVGSANGPLLLANLMMPSVFHEEKTVWDLAYDGTITVDGHNYYLDLEQYFTFASNSSLNGVCTVDQTLAELLKVVASVAGFDGDDNEWLKICKYYECYGQGAQQLEDPIKGLAPFSAYEAKLGLNVETNYFYYDRVIMPRGKLAKFVPDKSGVYRITSRASSEHGVNGWIFDGDRNELLCYEMDERMYNDDANVSMVFYMEAGKAYYIDIAFWDVYEVGYIYYDIEYVAPTMELFRLASPGYFTYDTDATGQQIYSIIAGGIDVILGEDGLYYEDLGNGEKGSLLYADFIGITSLFSNPIVSNNGVTGMIDLGGFDFSKTEEDLYVLGILKKYNNDEAAARAYLKEVWADQYDAYAAQYQLEDVLAGTYHGEGDDLTAEIKTYISKMYDGKEEERVGCVVVDQRLAEILQQLMDKYTFKDVDHSWTKLCYYYDYLGPEA